LAVELNLHPDETAQLQAEARHHESSSAAHGLPALRVEQRNLSLGSPAKPYTVCQARV
jgi:hypothetical protein